MTGRTKIEEAALCSAQLADLKGRPKGGNAYKQKKTSGLHRDITVSLDPIGPILPASVRYCIHHAVEPGALKSLCFDLPGRGRQLPHVACLAVIGAGETSLSGVSAAYSSHA